MITFIRVGVALLSIVAMSGQGLAQESKLPDGLRHVPPDALGFVHVRVGDFLKSPTGKALLQAVQADRAAAKGLNEVERVLWVKATEVDTVTLLVLALPPRDRWDMPGNRFRERDEWEMRRRMQMEMEMMRRKELEHLRWQKEKMEIKKDDKPVEEKKPVEKESPVLLQDFERQFDYRRLVHAHVAHGMNFTAMQLHDHIDDFGRPMFERLVIVTATKDFDRKAILRRSLDRGNGGGFAGPRQSDVPTIVFLGDRTVMLGDPWTVARYHEMIARQPGPKHRPLDPALALGVKPHLVVAGGHLAPDVRGMFFGPDNPNARLIAPLAPVLTTPLGVTMDLGTRLDVVIHAFAATDTSAANAMESLKTAKVLATLIPDRGQEKPTDLRKAIAKAIDGATIERNGKTVQARLSMDVPAELHGQLAKDLIVTLQRGPMRAQHISNLKQIALALHNHHDTYKHLPAAAISSRKNADGKPLLSWRVAILPFIEQEPLYRSFDLDQPWDHPTNKKLIPLMPPVYVMPGVDAEPGMTHYRTLVGPDTMLNPINGNGRLRPQFTLGNLPDGTSNTIMIVEAKEPTIWTKPDDLPYDPKGPLPKFGVWDDGFHVAMGDGSVRFVRANISERTLRSAITCSDGEVLGPDWDR
ncbi:MAG: DUF1559 domain-containing protein [Planctomycetes bacterium]|nr:DUF1559 domain-containing protein [Planctomycetota bacterium]